MSLEEWKEHMFEVQSHCEVPLNHWKLPVHPESQLPLTPFMVTWGREDWFQSSSKTANSTEETYLDSSSKDQVNQPGIQIMLSETEFVIRYHWKEEVLESLWEEIANPVDYLRSLPVLSLSLYEEPYVHVLDGFVSSVKRYGSKEAMIFEDGTVMSYADMYGRVCELVLVLRTKGLGEDDVIAVDAGRELGLPIWMYAIWMIGGVYMALGSRDPVDRKRRVLSISNARCVLVERVTEEVLDWYSEYVVVSVYDRIEGERVRNKSLMN